MKSLITLLFCFIGCLAYTPSAFCAGQGLTILGNGLAVEKVTHIAPSDLWHSISENNYHSSDGLLVSFWPIDAESAYRKEGWIVVGLVLSGRGDIAEEPASVKLWSKTQLNFAKAEASSYQDRHGKVALFFYPDGCTDVTKCKLVAVVLTLKDNTVLMNNKPVGVIKAP